MNEDGVQLCRKRRIYNNKLYNINKGFLEPLDDYKLDSPLAKLPLEESPIFLQVSEIRVLNYLLKPNVNKACGPDEIPNWFLKEYADIIAPTITEIINASFKEQLVPKIWKQANVTPIPKKKPIKDITKDLRPLSLTSCISKIAEDFVVNDYLRPAVLKVIDKNQFGAIPNSSTTQALISMVHNWLEATDGSGATIRTFMFDYRKAFDLIDYNILLEKICQLDLPHSIINWLIDFLTNRFQRVKLSASCFSEWGPVPLGIPQGTKVGPYLFLIMINDLNLSDTPLWKFVDDTTASEIVKKGQVSNAQSIVDKVILWSKMNRVQLNSDKCKEIRISFSKQKLNFQPVVVDGKPLKVEEQAKLLGITFNSKLTWNPHIEDTVKKASKRLFFLIQLKRSKVSTTDLVLFYMTCIRSVIDYAVPVFHHALPKYLMEELERIQKRAMAIIYPQFNYNDALSKANISTVKEHFNQICSRLFQEITNNSEHNLYNFLPKNYKPKYNIRKVRKFNIQKIKTERFGNSFIIKMSRLVNEHS